jgi:AcrR family transcriptional regulator
MMAKSGPPSKVASGGSERSANTRRSLIDAAIETLKENGFSGASARAIAERAGLNQGLVFYHFGSVSNLLLAALDAVSEDRMIRFNAAIENVSSPNDLMDVAAQIYREDLDTGHVTVLVEMIAGASSTPGLGAEVATRIVPWFAFTKDAIDKTFGDSPFASLLPADDVAYTIVALFLGLEMLTHLDGDRERVLTIFGRAQQLVTMLGAFNAFAPPKETP